MTGGAHPKEEESKGWEGEGGGTVASADRRMGTLLEWGGG